MLQAGMTAGHKMQRLHKSIVLVIIELLFVSPFICPLYFYLGLGFCSIMHFRGQVTSVTRKEKEKKDYAFWRQCNETPSIIPGCPGQDRSSCSD